MTAVVVNGELPSTGQVATRAVRAPHEQETADFCDLVSDLLGSHEAVLAVYPEWRPGRCARRIRAARLALGTDRLMGMSSPLSPLALSFTVDLLAHLAPYAPPGALPALARRAGRFMLAGAWLRSVTRLQNVPTRFSDHLRSYLPGATFLALSAPEAKVTRMEATVLQRLFRPEPPTQLLFTAHGQPEGDSPKALTTALAPAAARQVASQPWSAEFWGSKHGQEFLLFSTQPNVLSRILQSVPCTACRWCGRLIATPPCPFCLVSGQAPLSAEPVSGQLVGTAGSPLPPNEGQAH